MSRLIDADELLQEFEIETNIHRNNDGGFWHWTGIKAMIEKQPTAYNVEEVVKEVQDQLYCYDIPTDLLDDIIRKGGVKCSN